MNSSVHFHVTVSALRGILVKVSSEDTFLLLSCALPWQQPKLPRHSEEYDIAAQLLHNADSYEVIIQRQVGSIDASKDAPTNIIMLHKVCRSYFSKTSDLWGDSFSFLPSQFNSLSTHFDASEFDPELLVSISPRLGQEKTSAEVQSGGRSGFWENCNDPSCCHGLSSNSEHM